MARKTQEIFTACTEYTRISERISRDPSNWLDSFTLSVVIIVVVFF